MQREDAQELQTNPCSPSLLSSPASKIATSQASIVQSEATLQCSKFAKSVISYAAPLLVQNGIGHWPRTLTDDMR